MTGAQTAGCVVWITGLPSSGKSTFARLLLERLRAEGRAACVLDGDEVRAALHPAPGYTPEARDAFYATLADLSVLLADQALIVIVPATATRAVYRQRARERARRYIEVEIATPLEECERRDSKGLYARARVAQGGDMPGVGVAYERPERADVIAAGGRDPQALDRLLALIT